MTDFANTTRLVNIQINLFEIFRLKKGKMITIIDKAKNCGEHGQISPPVCRKLIKRRTIIVIHVYTTTIAIFAYAARTTTKTC